MNYIGIDLGTSSIKGLLVTEKGKILNEASYMYDVSYPAPNYSEQNPEELKQLMTTSLKIKTKSVK